jgi:hypothetical protein
MKRWFVYPPGASPPPAIERLYNPLRTVNDWFTDMYPKLLHLEQPFVHGDLPIHQAMRSEGYRPLECLQMPGDIMYLPASWSHQTINIGEAIGLGGQTALTARKRLSTSLEVLKVSPLNFEALKGAGLGLAHLAVEEESRVLQQLLATANGMVQLKSTNFDSVVLDGEDTWIVQLYLSGSDKSREIAALWNRLAVRLEGVASVGSFEMGSDRGGLGPVRDDDPQKLLFERFGVTIERLRFGPVIRYGRFLNLSSPQLSDISLSLSVSLLLSLSLSPSLSLSLSLFLTHSLSLSLKNISWEIYHTPAI